MNPLRRQLAFRHRSARGRATSSRSTATASTSCRSPASVERLEPAVVARHSHLRVLFGSRRRRRRTLDEVTDGGTPAADASEDGRRAVGARRPVDHVRRPRAGSWTIGRGRRSGAAGRRRARVQLQLVAGWPRLPPTRGRRRAGQHLGRRARIGQGDHPCFASTTRHDTRTARVRGRGPRLPVAADRPGLDLWLLDLDRARFRVTVPAIRAWPGPSALPRGCVKSWWSWWSPRNMRSSARDVEAA